jgi:hypothetical protein
LVFAAQVKRNSLSDPTVFVPNQRVPASRFLRHHQFSFHKIYWDSALISQQTANRKTCASDNQLMEAVVNRKEDALECIHKRYESLLRTVIMGIIRDESEVDGILHEVLLQVWDKGIDTIKTKRGCADSWSP